MRVSFFVVVEPSAPDFNGSLRGGKALVGAEERLTNAARSLGVTPLIDFVSGEAEELAAVAPEAPRGSEPELEKWYPAAEGLATVHALLRHVDNAPYPTAVREGLLDLRRVLEEVSGRGLQWHLDMDI